MSAEESGRREVRQTASAGLGRLVWEAIAWVAYTAGMCAVLLFGSGGFSVIPIAGNGMALALVACLCWAAVGRIALGLGAVLMLGLFFFIGNDPQWTIQLIAGSGLEPTYFGCCRE